MTPEIIGIHVIFDDELSHALRDIKLIPHSCLFPVRHPSFLARKIQGDLLWRNRAIAGLEDIYPLVPERGIHYNILFEDTFALFKDG